MICSKAFILAVLNLFRNGGELKRYALKLEYDGRPFAGWQRQKGQSTVQQSVERALHRLDPSKPAIVAAGRTDSGVHAVGQVAHCELTVDWDPFRLLEALNANLRPNPVAVLEASRVGCDFHARFSAVRRRYFYRLVTRRGPLTYDLGLAWHQRCALDGDAMRQAALHLIGKHDFTTFRSAHCQARSPVKTMDSLHIESFPVPGGTEYRFELNARSFLHKQARSIVGTLARVGAGAWKPRDVLDALRSRDRGACGPVAPSCGLYLESVGYPDEPFA